MKFMKMPKIKLLLEKQLTIVAQYFQPHVSYSAVKTWLDGIAQTVLSRLKNKYPAHSICSTTLEQFSFWRDNNIDDNFWNEIESRQIMWILEKYIFSELKIYKWHQLLITSDLKADCIKYNAECFRRHLLTVTYHIVARRLGICSILGIKETDIAITWKPKYHDGVIIGWHRECDRTFQTTLEQTNMCPYLQKCYGHDHNHVCTCQQYSANAHQLHYIILTENNSCKIYIFFLDQLSIRPPRKIDNIEIGRYFSSFEGAYYVPNESLRKHYPKDTAEIAKILAQQ
ncbi:uncharacterized protein LOC115244008 [Formica exsecta]|uniref:uncharacterized protein LOC115244008 n=1 Tax=Formica exsecta TaxID=72781 RepID=UPI001143F25C|nr:uncharacterized protein LOC115244008 [Formica exsecta]